MNTTTQTVSQATRRARAKLREIARVVVVDDNQIRASAIASALKGGSDIAVIVTAPDNRALQDELLPADLVLLALGGRQPSALATGALAVQRNPLRRGRVLLRRPGRARGGRGLRPRHHPHRPRARHGRRGWRGRAICWRGARCSGASRPPPSTPFRGRPRWPPSANGRRGSRCRRPRCSFARATSATCSRQSGSRQEAARRAGVPYRTMCEMIRKLGIAAD